METHLPSPFSARVNKLIYQRVPSGTHAKNYGKSLVLMGKSTISMAIFNSYFDITRGYLKTTSRFPLSAEIHRSNDSETEAASTSSGYKVTSYLPLDTCSWTQRLMGIPCSLCGVFFDLWWLIRRVVTIGDDDDDDGDDDDGDVRSSWWWSCSLCCCW